MEIIDTNTLRLVLSNILLLSLIIYNLIAIKMEKSFPPSYHTTAFSEHQQRLKHEAFSQFLANLEVNTFQGLGYGLALGLLMRRKFAFSALGAGIGAGVAFNKCAEEFNKIHADEHRIAEYVHNNELMKAEDVR